MKLASETSFWFAIALSSLLHAAVWLGDARRVIPSSTIRVDDRWSASSVEVGTEPEAAGQLVSPAAAAAEAAPAAEPTPAAPDPAPTLAAATDAETSASAASPQPIVERTPRSQRAKLEAPRKPQAVPSPAAAASEPTGAGSALPAQGPVGSMGALELPPGVRHLGPAFTRALPASGYADPRWSELPPGKLARTELEIVVDDSGHIADVSFDPNKPPEPVVEQWVKNTIMLLKAGVFSIDSQHVSAGKERLALEVTLSDEPSPAPDAAPRGLFRKGFEPPSAARPGYARFTLNSGRRMEATVQMLRARE